MRIKCESNASQVRSRLSVLRQYKVIDCNSWFALALGSSSVQYICLHCLKSQANPHTKPCVNAASVNGAFLFTLSEEIIDAELVLVHGFLEYTSPVNMA